MSDNDVEIKFGANIANFEEAVKQSQATLKSIGQVATFDRIANTARDAEKATHGLNFATSQATQEYIRLGHEAMTGNFSRIPGSIVVLAERLGGLHTIVESITPAMIGWAGVVAAATFAIYEQVSATDELADTQLTIKGAMELTGQSLSYNADQVQRNITYLREYTSLSNSEVQATAITFARAGNLADDLRNKVLRLQDAWEHASGESADKATANLIKMFSEPGKAAVALAENYHGLMIAEDALRIKQDEAANGADHAAEMLYGIVGPKLLDFDTQYVEPTVGWWERLKRVMVEVSEIAPSSANRNANLGIIPPAAPKGPTPEEKQKQDQLLQDNALVSRGLDLANQVKAPETELNRLLKERQTIRDALVKAQERGWSVSKKQLALEEQGADQKISAERKRMTEAASRDDLQIAREEINTKKQLAEIGLQQKKSELDAEVAAGRISHSKEIADLQQFAAEQYQIELKAIADEEKLSGLSVVDKKRLDDQKLVLEARYQAERAQIQKQAMDKDKQDWNKLFSSIDAPFQGMLQGILAGTQSWQQAMANLFGGLASSIIESIIEVLAEWALFEIATLGQGTWGEFVSLEAGRHGQFGNLLGSFDVGTPYVPATGLAMIHQGEMIIPAPQAEAIRSGQSSVGSPVINMNVSAVDAKSFINLINQPSIIRSLAKNIGAYTANNPSVRPAY